MWYDKGPLQKSGNFQKMLNMLRVSVVAENFVYHSLSNNPVAPQLLLEEAAQGKPSAKYRPTRVVVDAALRRIRKSRHGGHKFANISVSCRRI